MTEIRAVGFTEFGDPSVLRVVTVPMPEPGPGQVRVRVAAATVNPTDLGFRHGGRRIPEGVSPPYIPGMELAGVIDATGPSASSVSSWRAGDRVVAAVTPWERGGGAQAEYRVVDADQLARVPDGISLEAAATLPMNGMTARTALDMLALPPGSTLAVTGSAGAVGQYAIQLGTHDGLEVIGDAAPGADEELVRSFGAAHVVPRGGQAMAAAVRALYPSGVDAVLDAALLGPAILPAVRDGGQLLAVRPFQGETERGIKISLVMVGQHLHEGTRLASLVDLVGQGVVALRVAELLPPERAAEAHRRLEAGGVRGRLVLTI